MKLITALITLFMFALPLSPAGAQLADKKNSDSPSRGKDRRWGRGGSEKAKCERRDRCHR